MAAQRRGSRFGTPRLDIMWRPNDLGHPRLGLIVPRHGQTVVARNRLRRRLREAARRRILPPLPPLDLVIRARPSAYRSTIRHFHTDLERWARSLSG